MSLIGVGANMSEEIDERGFTRQEYDRLVGRGFFHEDDRLELIGGRLLVAEPQGARHTAAIQLAAEALRQAFGAEWDVRVQAPIALDAESEPEPDLAVVRGSPRDYVTAHPSRPALILEVAEWSLAFDRREKGSLYARAGIADYWIVNVVDGLLEVYRDPAPGAPRGWAYRHVRHLEPGASISPLAAPSTSVLVADLLP